MKTYISQPKSSDTVQPKSSNQALAKDVLQAYKERIVQRQDMDEDELLQGKFSDIAQLEEIDEDELLQGKFEASSTVQKEEAIQPASENNTGMPDNLKNGIEALSGYSMDDVRVHYNSAKPAQLQALAYAQGTDIHIAPGQEQHLPHEAWHVVQQKQGRVHPTMQLRGVNVNDNEGLEKEADVMGRKAESVKPNSIIIPTLSRDINKEMVQLTVKEPVPTNPKIEYNNIGLYAGSPEIQNHRLSTLKGSIPSVHPIGWDEVLSKATKVKGNWVRFHLINHNIGGPGNITYNLVPTLQTINQNAQWRGFEETLKYYYDNDKWIWCKVKVSSYHISQNGFPKKIEGEGQFYDGAAWQGIKPVSLDIGIPDFGSGIKTRTLDEMTASTWALLLDMGKGTNLVQYLNGLSSRYNDINGFNEALYDEKAPEIEDMYLRKIDEAIKGTHSLIYIAVAY